MAPDFSLAVQEQLSKELPFVVYRKPRAAITIAIFQDDKALNTIQDFSETGFVFAPFDTESPYYFLKPDAIIKDSTSYGSKSLKVNKREDPDLSAKTLYINLVEKAISEIKNGAFHKVVLSRSIKIHCEIPPLELLQALITRYDNALCYLWYHPKVGMWLGASPELLVHVDNNRFTTMALAGTKNYLAGTNPEWGAKEREEQDLVTTYITAALNEKIRDLTISETESVRAGNLWHLRTRITGLMKNNLEAVIRALHPTPAVCGIPMDSAKDFILKFENHERQFYTGFLGELNFRIENDRAANKKNLENKAYKLMKTETELFVNLRCLRLKENSATLFVGGGVTKDSVPELEWEETVAKSRTILDVFLNR